MIIPLTESEIAEYLDISEECVRTLWKSGLLKRTVSCADRMSKAIMHSSPYDVIEYALASGSLPIELHADHAELWTLKLADAVDGGNFLDNDLAVQSSLLMDQLLASGLTCSWCDALTTSKIVVESLNSILCKVIATDSDPINVTAVH